MSKDLNWYPPPKDRAGNSIYALKRLMAEKFGTYDGSMSENLGFVGEELIPFLDGIIAGNGSGDMARDAKKLKDAIEKYGQVELIIEE